MSGKIIDVSNGLNYNSSKRAENPNMQVYKGELYCAWQEYTANDSNRQIKVKKYDGYSWKSISSNLNYDTNADGEYANLEVYKEELYCIWDENNKIKIKKYNGINWSNVSENLNYGKYVGYRASMQVYKNELYCAWCENTPPASQIIIKKYNGTSWTNISSNLNYDVNSSVLCPIMKVYKDELYCTWYEGSNAQIKIKKYNGSSWSNISGNLNYNGDKNAQGSDLQVYKNDLYCIWYERNNSGSNYQIKMKKYNGISWNNISNNLNYDGDKEALYPKMQIYKDELYCIWTEYNGHGYQIKVKKYDGNSWTNISDSLNYDKNKYVSYSTMQVYKNELYCSWCEDSYIKMKKYILLTEKFLIKQNDNYISIKAEFYKNGQYQALTLEGDTVPNDNDFINSGFENLDDLCKDVSVENNVIKVKSNASDYEDGKIFSFNIDSEFKNINNVE